MTHPIYSQTTLEALTVKELKTIASQIGAIPDRDKRAKQTWVSAIIDHQIMFSPAKVEAMEAHIAEVMSRLESVTPDAPELPTVDTYIPTPPTQADDVAFASAMGLTYDDVFGKDPEPTTQSLEPTPKSPPILFAYIVALVAVLAFSLGVLIIKTGFTAFAWVLTALSPLALGMWRYLVQSPTVTQAIDYIAVSV
jgi:hypothetical protein